MSNLFDRMISELRSHWVENSGAYPQCFELLRDSLEQLNRERAIVAESMHFSLESGWENSFHGVELREASDGNFLLKASGERVAIESS